MTEDTFPPEVADLAERFPGWRIARRWFAAVSGPDRAQYVAERGRARLASSTIGGLGEQLATYGGGRER